MTSVSIAKAEIRRGHRVTFNYEVVEVPFDLIKNGVIGLTNIIDRAASLNIEAIVTITEGKTFINGDELVGTRYISILDFVK